METLNFTSYNKSWHIAREFIITITEYIKAVLPRQARQHFICRQNTLQVRY